jgi:uncharacterized radical SAM protein YgiQ
MVERGWDQLDVLFVTGDAYVDHPAFGVPLLARLLESEGYRVGVLAQPDWRNPQAMQAMGRPRLFAAVSAGAMDSMVNHYTAAKKLRRNDAYTPGGRSGSRPNRAVIAYSSALKGAFKGLPVVIGGIEASLRRLAHYDYWSDSVRRSLLVDSKASLLLYGMAETALLELTRRLADGEALETIRDLRGSALLCSERPAEGVELPSFEAVVDDTAAFNESFRLAAGETNPYNARPLLQRHGSRWLLVNPPPLPLNQSRLDRLYALPFQRRPHPDYNETIPAFEQIRHSVTSHRGCCGGCAFCAIAQHQGKFIQSRSEQSICREVQHLASDAGFRGTVSDVGGPSANMYGMSCGNAEARRQCRRDGCLFPAPCPHLQADDRAAVHLLKRLRAIKGVRHLFIASGVRLDLLEKQPHYQRQLIAEHVSGLLKVAPESLCDELTRMMRKPGPEAFETFLACFRKQSQACGKRQSVVPYLIAGHPGSTLEHMVETALLLRRLGLQVEQVQEFTPTPGTLSSCLYHTGCDPFNGEPVHVPRSDRERRLQKALLLSHLPENRSAVREALRRCGRESDGSLLFASETTEQRPTRQRRGRALDRGRGKA